MRTTRTLLLVAVVLTGAVVAAGLLLGGGGAGDPGAPVAEEPRPSAGARAEPRGPSGRDDGAEEAGPRLDHALAVLRHWDLARARAWTDGDARALRRLYVVGSVAGRRDVAMLRAWRARGVLPDRLDVQVLEADLRPTDAGQVRLLVTDRVVVAVDDGAAPTTLDDEPTTRLVELRRPATPSAGWRVAAVYDRPAATTSATPRSRNR